MKNSIIISIIIGLIIGCSGNKLPETLERNPVNKANFYCSERGGLKGIKIRLTKDGEIFYYMADCYNGESYDLDR